MTELLWLTAVVSVITLAAGVALGRAAQRRAPLLPPDDEGRIYHEGPPIPRDDIRAALRKVEQRAQGETNADRAAAIREAALIIEEALLTDS